jgi:hypothetical protein
MATGNGVSLLDDCIEAFGSMTEDGISESDIAVADATIFLSGEVGEDGLTGEGGKGDPEDIGANGN